MTDQIESFTIHHPIVILAQTNVTLSSLWQKGKLLCWSHSCCQLHPALISAAHCPQCYRMMQCMSFVGKAPLQEADRRLQACRDKEGWLSLRNLRRALCYAKAVPQALVGCTGVFALAIVPSVCPLGQYGSLPKLLKPWILRPSSCTGFVDRMTLPCNKL